MIKSVTRSAGAGASPEPVYGEPAEPVERVSFDYDEQGTDLKITDELGRVVEAYALDAAGRPTSVTNNLGQTLKVTYAVLDYPQKIQRFDGSSVYYGYDVAWRPTSIVYPDDTVTPTLAYALIFAR